MITKHLARSRRLLLTTSLLTLAILLITPASALACGGFFSSATSGKVSQDTERLLITINHNSTTLYEQIRYQGNARDFAWVLPVPAVPKVETAAQEIFNQLEYYTAPRFFIPAPQNCNHADITHMLFGNNYATGGAPTSSNPGVNVYAGGETGPFAYEIIKSGDAQALTSWLQNHKYTVPANTTNLIQPYVRSNMFFLAMRLRPGTNVSNVAPVKITFPMVMQQVTVPIRLAATDIQHKMKMEVSILAQQRYTLKNYTEVTVPADKVSANPSPQESYAQLMDTAIQKVGGYAYVTQYAQAQNMSGLLRSLKESPDTTYNLTRFYTSYTPEHMQKDPVFVPQANLPAKQTYIRVNDTSPGPDCTTTYIKSAVLLAVFPIGPIIILTAIGIWYWRKHKARTQKNANK
ncbi:hypothetical protein KDW_47530 [Dictyobacter vulcani]|uniref:DUF2330 domain-containing protein n=1 Tax=Dictyobacter vulcani TaxID=2607529 RepID=A0A5J4KVT8_9CHLR|nr:DUF2330 domain-containing protein [Dictyobacter vulcani]GER90591.1 hypothetical protein KDW_47530 [Dictyobacter vulcani]